MHSFEIFVIEKYADLETQVRGHSKSLKLTPFDKSHTNLYSHFIVTLQLACSERTHVPELSEFQYEGPVEIVLPGTKPSDFPHLYIANS